MLEIQHECTCTLLLQVASVQSGAVVWCAVALTFSQPLKFEELFLQCLCNHKICSGHCNQPSRDECLGADPWNGHWCWQMHSRKCFLHISIIAIDARVQGGSIKSHLPKICNKMQCNNAKSIAKMMDRKLAFREPDAHIVCHHAFQCQCKCTFPNDAKLNCHIGWC